MTYDTAFAQIGLPTVDNPTHIVAACGYQNIPVKRYIVSVASSDYVNGNWTNTFGNDFYVSRDDIQDDLYAEFMGVYRDLSSGNDNEIRFSAYMITAKRMLKLDFEMIINPTGKEIILGSVTIIGKD